MSEQIQEGENSTPRPERRTTHRRRGLRAFTAAMTALALAGVELSQHSEPAPAIGCEVTLPVGGTLRGIAEQITEHTGEDPAKIVFEIRQASPALDPAQLDPWQRIGIPVGYCPVIEQYHIGQEPGQQ